MVPALLQPGLLLDWVQSAVVFSIALVASFAIRYFLLRGLNQYSNQRQTAGKILYDSLFWPSLIWCIAAALLITLESVELPGNAARWARGGSVVFLVLSISVSLATLVVRLSVFQATQRGLSFSGVARALVYVFFLLLGSTVLLRYFDLTITPVLTALGVGGLAVALALRDTLANFFAGIHILVEAPISVGNFIKLSSGEEGTVVDIGWRTTRVQTGANNTIVIPNEKITSSILTNYAIPDEKVMVEVAILTGFDADLRRVEQILVEEAREAEKVLPEFAPLVLFDPGVTPTHLQFKLIVKAAHRLHQGAVQSSIRSLVLERFRKEGIPPPAIPGVSPNADRN